MHIIDIWLEEIKIFAPSNLKNLFIGIADNLLASFRYLFIDWWWFSLLILFSHIIMYGLISMIMHPALIMLLQGLFLAAKAFYAFLAALAAFPASNGKSSSYYSSRQMFVWPIVTPFVLWIYFSWHIYKFLSHMIKPEIIIGATWLASYIMLLGIDWFASPLFMYFAFIIIGSHAMHGIRHSLEHAFGMLYYTYPVSAIMFVILYGINYMLHYCVTLLAKVDMLIAMAFNPIAILIPIAAILFSAVFQWHMGLTEDYQ